MLNIASLAATLTSSMTLVQSLRIPATFAQQLQRSLDDRSTEMEPTRIAGFDASPRPPVLETRPRRADEGRHGGEASTTDDILIHRLEWDRPGRYNISRRSRSSTPSRCCYQSNFYAEDDE